MAKTKISEFSATPGNNTDIDGINIAEGCAPSGINDAIRELMAQLKDFQAGTAGDSFNGPVGTTTAAAGAFTTLSASGAVTLSGGTANGVAYLNGSKVLTTGSALVFDGSNLGLGVTPSAWNTLIPLEIGFAGNSFSGFGGDSGIYATTAARYQSGWKYAVTGKASTLYAAEGGAHKWSTAPSGTAGNTISFTQAMTLDASGNLLVGTTDAGATTGPGHKLCPSTTQPNMFTVANTAGNTNTYHYYNTNATNNGYRFYVNINGGIYNYSGNNSNLSDERTKTNIELAGDYLQKICAIPVKTFNYKDEPNGEQKTLGVIAQDVEAVAPELVNITGFGETPDDGVPLKSIYTTDFQYALMKCIQELNAKVEAQAAEIAALKGQA